jgi:hypothetical protein
VRYFQPGCATPRRLASAFEAVSPPCSSRRQLPFENKSAAPDLFAFADSSIRRHAFRRRAVFPRQRRCCAFVYCRQIFASFRMIATPSYISLLH